MFFNESDRKRFLESDKKRQERQEKNLRDAKEAYENTPHGNPLKNHRYNEWQEQESRAETAFVLNICAFCIRWTIIATGIAIIIAISILAIPHIHYIASFVFFYCIGIDLLYCGYVNSFDFSNCYDSYAFSTSATINILMLITFIHTLFLFKKIRRQAIKFHIIFIVLAVMIQFFLQ